MQSFIHELAQAGGKDPVEFRYSILDASPLPLPSPSPGQPAPPAGGLGAPFNAKRMRGVLELVVAKSNWANEICRKERAKASRFISVIQVTLLKSPRSASMRRIRLRSTTSGSLPTSAVR